MATQLQMHGARGETSVSYLPVEDASAENAQDPMVELLRKKRKVGGAGGVLGGVGGVLGGVGGVLGGAVAVGAGAVGGAMRRRRRRMTTTTTSSSSSLVAGCCPTGCLVGFVGCIYFFVIVPTGVLLTWHGHTTDSPLTFGLGISLLLVSTFVVPGILIATHYFHKIRTNRMSSAHSMSDTSNLEAGVEKIDMRILTPNSPAVHPCETVS